MRVALVVIVLCLVVGVCELSYAQGGIPRVPLKPKPLPAGQPIDSTYSAIPPADSARMYDSIYKLRRKEVDEREKIAALTPVQDAFFTLSASISALNRVKAPDLNEYFAERSDRPDHAADRGSITGLDRFITLGGQFHITPSIAVGIEYDFIAKYFSTVVDADTVSHWPTTEEHLDVTYHALMVGPEITLLSSRFIKLKVMGGLGPAIAFVSELESATGVSRSSSAGGLAVSFDIATDLRVISWASFRIDLFARSISTGELSTSGNTDLTAPLGAHTATFTLAPRASAAMFGLAIGGVVYF